MTMVVLRAMLGSLRLDLIEVGSLRLDLARGGVCVVRGLYDAKVVGADDGCAKVVMCNDFGYGWRWGWCGDDGLGGG